MPPAATQVEHDLEMNIPPSADDEGAWGRCRIPISPVSLEDWTVFATRIMVNDLSALPPVCVVYERKMVVRE
jgi:hypothetical protein